MQLFQPLAVRLLKTTALCGGTKQTAPPIPLTITSINPYPMSDQDFFDSLLAKTKAAFEQSPLKAKHPDARWFYSVCGTPVQTGKPVVLGINWGVGTSEHEAQTTMPDGNDVKNYDFIRDSSLYVKKHFNLNASAADYNYSNLCFFRTPDIGYLSSGDYQLSLPLFEEFIAHVKPPYILSIGTTNFDVLRGQKRIADWKQTDVPGASMQGQAARYKGVKCFFVPHPQARLSNEHRVQLWEQTTALAV